MNWQGMRINFNSPRKTIYYTNNRTITQDMGNKESDLMKDKENGIFDNLLKKKAKMREKEYNAHKLNSIKTSIFVGLFIWLIIGIWQKNILLSAAIATILTAVIFVIMLNIPLMKHKKRLKQIEAELPLILIKIANEVQFGKSLTKAVTQAGMESGEAAKEFTIIGQDLKKGLSFEKALENLNERLDSLNIRRMNANLANLQKQGSADSTSIKKLAEELLLKQKIETKEFSGKMVLFALVFIAVSAIVPAMFMSFVLIGSFFMSLKFTPQQILLIGCVGFPVIDFAVLMMIESKTPIFLKQ